MIYGRTAYFMNSQKLAIFESKKFLLIAQAHNKFLIFEKFKNQIVLLDLVMRIDCKLAKLSFSTQQLQKHF